MKELFKKRLFQVYEWALLHAKRIDDNKDTELLMVSYPRTAIDRLKKYVGTCTNEVVSALKPSTVVKMTL